MSDDRQDSRNEDLFSRALERAQGAARANRATAALPSLAEEPPRPGDVLAHSALRGLPVQWVVVSSSAGLAESVVPVDAGTMMGSGDVAFTEPTSLGRMTARCRLEQPLFPAALASARRSARLNAASLERLERRRAALAAKREGSYTEIETDQDPEYQDWLAEVVEPACRQWRELGLAKVLPLPARQEPSPLWLRWAAGIAAVVGLGALSGLWLQAGRVAKLETTVEQQQAAITSGEAERRARVQELEDQVVASEAARKAAEELAGRELAAVGGELRRARDAALVINPTLALLEPIAAVRGEVKAITLQAKASHLLLFLPVDQVVGGTLRLELSDGSEGKLLWQKNPLERQKGHEVSVGVPAALLPSGELVLRLYRRERGREELVREHHLRVEREQTPATPRGLLP